MSSTIPAVLPPAPPIPPSAPAADGLPTFSPMQVPTTQADAVIAAGATGGGPATASPMQDPLSPSAVNGAAGGGQAVQTPPVQQAAAAPAPAALPGQAPVQQTPTQVAGGGGAGSLDMTAIIPVLQQVISALTALVSILPAHLAASQAQAGAAGAAAGGGTGQVAGDAGAGVDQIAGGGGAPPAGNGCCCAGASIAQAAGKQVSQYEGAAGAPEAKPKKSDTADKQDAPKITTAATTTGGGSGKLDRDDLTVKGTKIDAKQRANLEAVLRVGKEMGANDRVMKSAIMTVIQESVARNDSSVDSKDLDSLGLFQQRPSQGWGTRAQISDPAYAARKYFEKAIPNDKKKPDQPLTLLAQSVQISAYPQAYAKHEGEAEKILADFKG